MVIENVKITDPVYTSVEHNRLDRFFLKLIRDERDLPFIYLSIRITLFMIIPGILLYFTSGWIWWMFAAVYLFFNNFSMKGPFGLMLHCTSHRPFFKKEYGILNNYLPWVVAPFFGHTPETYFVHHIGMHHVEGNMDEDDSSTMHYQRDSFKDFLRYFGIFFVKGIANLYRYHKARGNKKLMRKMVAGEISFYLMVIALSFVNLPTTIVVFFIPLLIFRLITMVGNWTQHAFVSTDEPDNDYKNSTTCINVRYNRRCWNDGYHLSHHLKPNRHWTEHPAHLVNNKDEYASNRAIVFNGLDFGQVFLNLMQKKYDVLADHMININGVYGSKDDMIALLKSRTMKIERASSASTGQLAGI